MSVDGSRDVSDAARRWGAFFEGLTPDNLPEIETLCRPDVRFKDPFNDVTGTAALRRIFDHMFETTVAPRFTVTDTAVSGRTAYLRWRFDFTPKGRSAPWRIEGMSEVTFDDAGLVTAHIDHWDSGEQFYAKLPIIGPLVRLIRRRVES